MPQIPKIGVIGPSAQEEERITTQWDTLPMVVASLETKGIYIPDKPPPFPCPEVVTTLVDSDNQEYLKSNCRYLAWLNYLTPHISLIEGMLDQIKNEQNEIAAVYRRAARESNIHVD